MSRDVVIIGAGLIGAMVRYARAKVIVTLLGPTRRWRQASSYGNAGWLSSLRDPPARRDYRSRVSPRPIGTAGDPLDLSASVPWLLRYGRRVRRTNASP
jgi:glycine/D-amino acid oxidase-like deaminating enzyme